MITPTVPNDHTDRQIIIVALRGDLGYGICRVPTGWQIVWRAGRRQGEGKIYPTREQAEEACYRYIRE